ncbi:MAG: hypothetical protein ACFFG0_12370 [Candidatus Thorarchaeota archaeon]
MVLIIKKLVDRYKETNNVPKKYRNLKKQKHVTTFKKYYPNIAEILINKYKLDWNDRIIAFGMTRINLPHFKNYRTPFKKRFSGTIKELKKHVLDFFEERVWKRK